MRPFLIRILRPLRPVFVPASILAPALLLQGCGGWQSILEPHSPGARQIERYPRKLWIAPRRGVG
ncbi:MAG: hypothetical protein EA421_11340 [Gemmatimonadales bacterium]|nr:MAG: hypothetical protein EA421_11340 [Gemmatimonadales bacterium]